METFLDNNTLVVLGICGFLTVCFGLLVLAFVTIFRFSGRNFLGFFSLLVGRQRELDQDDTHVLTVHRNNLRQMASEQDFDAALAKHIVTDQPGSQPPIPTGQTQVAQPPGLTATPFNPPLPGTPKAPTVLPGFVPGTGQPPPNAAPPPSPRPAVVPPTPSNAPTADPGWENPALTQRNFNDLRRRDRDDDDDLFGGLLGGDDGGVLG